LLQVCKLPIEEGNPKMRRRTVFALSFVVLVAALVTALSSSSLPFTVSISRPTLAPVEQTQLCGIVTPIPTHHFQASPTKGLARHQD
jgi:hypothetical protein